MKKHLIVSALLLITTFASAQTLSIIPKIGATFSTVATEFDENIKSKPGFTLGAAVNYGLTDMLSVQPELNFIQKGFKEEYSESWDEEVDGRWFYYQNDFKQVVTINYIELPVLARATFGKVTKFHVMAGPSLGFALGGKYKQEGSFTESYDDEVFVYPNDAKGSIKFGKIPDGYEGNDRYIDNRIDFGLQFGGGVLVANKILLEVRYGLGLSNSAESTATYEKKNRVIQFTVGMPIQPK
ncbi:MAG TPA: porin family protein [Cyclobacteriaceae bacterium]|nr:porin family protein [Cyclobacteriaceae bacterium]HRJ80872.1 porin family protein [Cyclobacteriaceae bacterium]